jgi:hypothetical protein
MFAAQLAITPLVGHTVGDMAHGGIIAYILRDGDPGYDAGQQHGLVISGAPYPNDWEYPWSDSTEWLGTTSYAIGTHSANCTAIINQSGHTTSAALYCRNLVSGGYSDWNLPSVYEQLAICENAAVLGIDQERAYWTSSEYHYAWDPGPGKAQGAFVAWWEGEWYEDCMFKSESSLPFYSIRSF